VTPPPNEAVARFRGDVERLFSSVRAERSRGTGSSEAETLPRRRSAKSLDVAREEQGAGGLGLAVSGGPDSMAMLALAAAAFPAQVAAATFDHRLREGSAAEARMVADACAALGVPHATLAPDAPIAGSSLQMRARAARYAALTRWAGKRPLLTAHHADDQAETLLMRLNRASGVAGLAGVRSVRWEGATAILRPLLGWRRAELRAIIIASGLPFVDDPSNADPRHDRTRVRALLAASPDLDPVGMGRSAAYLAEAEEVLAMIADTFWSQHWRGPDRPFAAADAPRELRRRLIRRAIRETRAALGIVLPAFTDSANVEPLLDALEAGRGAVQGGVMVAATRAGWRFRAAPPRRSV
jgi:tRNA(Ile)-lysidine synthase